MVAEAETFRPKDTGSESGDRYQESFVVSRDEIEGFYGKGTGSPTSLDLDARAEALYGMPAEGFTFARFPDIYKTTDADGLNLSGYQATEIIARGWEKAEIADTRDNRRPSGKDIADAAEHLGKTQPERWRNDTPRGIYKCNLFLDASLRQAGLVLPWDERHIPSVHGMCLKLGEHPEDWEKAWPDGKTTFAEFQQKAGDCSFWDKTVYGTPVRHCSILDGAGNMSYAGSIQTGGFAQDKVTDFIKSVFGEPTAVFRSKHLRN